MQLQLDLGRRQPKGQRSLRLPTCSLVLDKAAPDRDNSPQLLREIREKTLLSRGTAQLQLRNIAGARQDFEAARDINPNDPVVYNSLALVSLAENKPADAITLLRNCAQG